MIAKDLPNARLVLAGDGPSRVYFSKVVADLDLTPFVKSIVTVPHDKVPEVMVIEDVSLQTNDL